MRGAEVADVADRGHHADVVGPADAEPHGDAHAEDDHITAGTETLARDDRLGTGAGDGEDAGGAVAFDVEALEPVDPAGDLRLQGGDPGVVADVALEGELPVGVGGEAEARQRDVHHLEAVAAGLLGAGRALRRLAEDVRGDGEPGGRVPRELEAEVPIDAHRRDTPNHRPGGEAHPADDRERVDADAERDPLQEDARADGGVEAVDAGGRGP